MYMYIYGRHVIIQNDHNPLEMIQHKPVHTVPPPTEHAIAQYSINIQ